MSNSSPYSYLTPKPWAGVFFQLLVGDGMLTQQQAKRAALLDSPTGGQYVGLLLDETEYEFTTGLVGVVLKSGPASVLLGRIVPAGNGVFHLSATGPDENMARLHQSDIASMHQCVLVTNRAVC